MLVGEMSLTSVKTEPGSVAIASESVMSVPESAATASSNYPNGQEKATVPASAADDQETAKLLLPSPPSPWNVLPVPC